MPLPTARSSSRVSPKFAFPFSFYRLGVDRTWHVLSALLPPRRSAVPLCTVRRGYYGAASRTYKHAKEQVQHSLQYQYRDRRNKKREIRSLWITRINAAARLNDISYSQFMHGLKVAGIELDRKVLAQMAYEDIESFNELATIAKKALEA